MGWSVHDYPGPPPERPMPHCPICGEECETIYVDNYTSNVICCDVCMPNHIWERDAYEWMEDQQEAERYQYEEHY